MMPQNEYVEIRNGAYYVAGTRVGLDVIVTEFNAGRSPEYVFEAYPSLGSLGKVYGAMAFILDHPDAVADYLQQQERRYERFQAENPFPADMLDRYERARQDGSAKPH
jgi:uncharacterized protein (DUF433 family)